MIFCFIINPHKIKICSFEKSERSREVGIFDEGSEPVNSVVEIVVAETHGRVVEHIAELEHRLVFEEGVPLLDAIYHVIFILFHP